MVGLFALLLPACCLHSPICGARPQYPPIVWSPLSASIQPTEPTLSFQAGHTTVLVECERGGPSKWPCSFPPMIGDAAPHQKSSSTQHNSSTNVAACKIGAGCAVCTVLVLSMTAAGMRDPMLELIYAANGRAFPPPTAAAHQPPPQAAAEKQRQQQPPATTVAADPAPTAVAGDADSSGIPRHERAAKHAAEPQQQQAAAKQSGRPHMSMCDASEVQDVATLNALYVQEGVVIRGWEHCGDFGPADVRKCMLREIGDYCEHEGGVGTGMACDRPHAPASLLHPSLTILQHPFASWFEGTPRARLNQPEHFPRSLSIWQLWVFSIFRGCLPAECTYPQDAWGLPLKICDRMAGMCPAGTTGEANARAFLGNNIAQPMRDGSNTVLGRYSMCAFPATEEGDREMIIAQNMICAIRNASFRDPPTPTSLITSWEKAADGGWIARRDGSICEENQRQVYWSGHDPIVALAFLDPAHKVHAFLVQDAIKKETGRTIPVVFPHYDSRIRRLRFDTVDG
jgi:hypothetical protein